MKKKLTTKAKNETADNKKIMQESEKKWGSLAIESRFSIVPVVLIRKIGALGLSSTEFCVLLQLISWWTKADKPPSVAIGMIMASTGKSRRTVQNAIEGLERKKLIIRREMRRRGSNKSGPNEYDLAPLKKIIASHAAEAVIKDRSHEKHNLLKFYSSTNPDHKGETSQLTKKEISQYKSDDEIEF